MRPGFRIGFGLCCALALIASTATQPDSVEGAENDPFADDRSLQCRVTVTAKGVPLRHVVKKLSAVAGVPLSVSGRAGDERTIAFAREAPLHEVMGSLAELYRLQWSRKGTGAATRYVLAKSPESAREEADARTRSFGAAHAGWVDQAVDARNPARPERSLKFRWPGLPPILLDAGIKECQARILPRAAAELPRLVREGVISQPLALWPPAEREQVIRAVQGWLNHRTEALHQLSLPAAEESLRNGTALPEGSRRQPKAPGAERSSLEMELEAKPDLSLAISIRTPHGGNYPLAREPARIPVDPGLRLYAGRALRPVVKGGPPPAGDPAGSDPWNRRLSATGFRVEDPSSLYGTLETISRRGGCAIYADDYAGTWLMSNRRPGGGYDLPDALTAGDALDAFCREGASEGDSHSYWWRRKRAALIRSRHWLWEAEAVLPADLAQSLAASLRRTGRPGAADLARIASLTGLQVASLQTRPQGLRAWKTLVQAPNRLSLASRMRLPGRGLSWEDLPDPDRIALMRLLPQLRTGDWTYSARVAGRLERSYGANSTAVLDLEGRCGPEPLSANLRIPVPNLREGLTITRY